MRSIPKFITAEVKDIVIAVAALTAAFTILFMFSGSSIFGGSMALIALFSFASVLTAFLLHELAHRFTARRFGGIAFFKLWLPGVLLVIFTSFLRFLIAAPGAVNIGGIFRKDQIGKTALAGPLTNLVIGGTLYGVLFFAPAAFLPNDLAQGIFLVSGINLWFGLFNLIPLPPLDGEKIFRWSIEVYIAMVVAAIILNLLNGLFI